MERGRIAPFGREPPVALNLVYAAGAINATAIAGRSTL